MLTYLLTYLLNNNNNRIYIAPYCRNFRGVGDISMALQSYTNRCTVCVCVCVYVYMVNKMQTVRQRPTRSSTSVIDGGGHYARPASDRFNYCTEQKQSSLLRRASAPRTGCPVHPGVPPARSYDPAPAPQPPVAAEKPPPATSRSVALAAAIDRYSRVVFPLIFAAFNAVYWAIYLTISARPKEKGFVFFN